MPKPRGPGRRLGEELSRGPEEGQNRWRFSEIDVSNWPRVVLPNYKVDNCMRVATISMSTQTFLQSRSACETCNGKGFIQVMPEHPSSFMTAAASKLAHTQQVQTKGDSCSILEGGAPGGAPEG